jgi:hypothetical protein
MDLRIASSFAALPLAGQQPLPAPPLSPPPSALSLQVASFQDRYAWGGDGSAMYQLFYLH